MVRKLSLILSILAASVFIANAATVTGVVDSGAGAAAGPVAGAIVMLTPTAGGTAHADTTNATGDYSITGVPVGTYVLTATHAGLDDYTALANVVIFNAGQTVTRNITMTVLLPGITISGAVQDSATGNPLAGGKVLLRTIGGGAITVDSAIVALNGTYALDSVQTGTYNLIASAAGHTTQTLRVTVAAANLTRNFLLVGLPAGIVISGTVTDTVSGNPLAGAKVYLRTGGGGTLVDSAIAAANGTYSIDSVLPGTYRLVASAALHTTKTEIGVVVAAANITRNFQLVGLPAGIIISGLVTDSVSGTPLAGAIVRLRTGVVNPVVVDSAITAANGAYAIDSVDAGTYSLNATAANHNAKTVAGVVVAAVNVTENIQLLGLPAGIVISGTVTDSVRGTPLAGAIVRLRTGGVGGGALLDSAIAAANGTYSIDSVQPGTYSLNATAAGHTAKTVAGIVVGAANLTRNFQLVGLPGVDISGNVADSVSGLPLAGAVVRALQGTVLVDSAIVAANGTYTLISVPAGTYTLTANAAGHGTKTLSGVVVANVSLTENFLLVSGGTGTVSAANTAKMLKPDFSISAAGILQLRNFSDQGVVSVFSVNGKLVYHTGIVANATAVVLPKTMVGGMYLVSVTQKSMVYRKQVIMQ
jgi:protocatechuate 3,4-dioxygenase beta subunit